jgi:hypothetical protein
LLGGKITGRVDALLPWMSAILSATSAPQVVEKNDVL